MATEIKHEQTDESCAEIQKYLNTFSEECANDDENRTNDDDDGDLGTYFVDEDGQLYFQPATCQVDIDNGTKERDKNVTIEEKVTVENNNKENKGTDEAEEVSYVYIVEEGEEDNRDEFKGENDITVYDFDDENDEDSLQETPVEIDAKPVTTKAKRIHYCPHCDYSNTKKIAVQKHMKVHSDDKPYKCSVCGKGFRALIGLTNHENTHTGTKPFLCKICNARFTTSGEIVRHVRYRHSNLRPHKCNECDYAAVELSKLRRHQRSHTGERPYQCPHCTYASPDTFKLKRHLRVHTGERPYKCEICQAAFSQSNSLKAHRLIHFPEKKPSYACALCPVTCSRKADLRSHISKLHTAVKPFECKRCGKHLSDRYSYKMHIRSHSGEKSYKCPYCLYASISKLHLESHMYIHTNEKPYECDECDYRSRQRQLLKRHKNIYHNPDFVPPEPNQGSHECEICNKRFIHTGNLIKHLAIHDPESRIHEEKEALRIGRKRRIQVKQERGNLEDMSAIKEVEEFEDDDDDDDRHYVVLEMIDEQNEVESKGEAGNEKGVDLKADMENCFGFDEDDENDD